MNAADNIGGLRRIGNGTANQFVLPSIAVAATGPQSRWSAACEQYLDGAKAGIIAANLGQDLTSSPVNAGSPHFGTIAAKAQRAAGEIVQVSLPTRANTRDPAAGPATARLLAVAGLAAEAWQKTPGLGILSANCPASWHHPIGIRKVLRRIEPRLPDVAGRLFLTLSLDPNLFADPGSAFDCSRPRIRKLFAKLRRGVPWEGKLYRVTAAYCVKVEFHENGWPHFHLIVLTTQYLPGSLLNHLWNFGRCNVQRINNRRFHYLLKYVTKGAGYPGWVLTRRRLRVFQPSHGFMQPPEIGTALPENKIASIGHRRGKRASYTIGERLHRWARMALLNEGWRYRTVLLSQPFQAIFDGLIFSIAEAKRYLGNGFIKIDNDKELIPWLLTKIPGCT